MNIWQIQVWSIKNQHWETYHTTGSREKAQEVWSNLHNNGLSPRIVRL